CRLLRIRQRDLPEWNMEVRVALRRVIDFLAGIDRPGGDLRHHQLALAGDLVHLFTPGSARVVTLTMRASRSSLEIPECVGEGGVFAYVSVPSPARSEERRV